MQRLSSSMSAAGRLTWHRISPVAAPIFCHEAFTDHFFGGLDGFFFRVFCGSLAAGGGGVLSNADNASSTVIGHKILPSVSSRQQSLSRTVRNYMKM